MGICSPFFAFSLPVFQFEALAQGEDYFNQALASHEPSRWENRNGF